MQRIALAASLAFTMTLAVAASVPARAAAPSHADQAAITNFRLTESFLKRDQAYVLDTRGDPCRYSMMSTFMQLLGGNVSLDRAASAYDARPGVHELLAKHGLTAREAILGGFAMFITGMKVASGGPDGRKMDMTVSGASTPVMRENVEFYKAHLPEIHQFQARMDAAGRELAQRSGGKMPACAGSLLQVPAPTIRQ